MANPVANLLLLLIPRWGGFDNWDLVIEMEVSLFDMPPAGITCTRRFATGFATGLPLVCHWLATAVPLHCHWTRHGLPLAGSTSLPAHARSFRVRRSSTCLAGDPRGALVLCPSVPNLHHWRPLRPRLPVACEAQVA